MLNSKKSLLQNDKYRRNSSGINLNAYIKKVKQKTIVGPEMQNVGALQCVDTLIELSSEQYPSSSWF